MKRFKLFFKSYPVYTSGTYASGVDFPVSMEMECDKKHVDQLGMIMGSRLGMTYMGKQDIE